MKIKTISNESLKTTTGGWGPGAFYGAARSAAAWNAFAAGAALGGGYGPPPPPAYYGYAPYGYGYGYRYRYWR